MKNTIYIYGTFGITEEELDELMPFENHRVALWGVYKHPSGHGHYKLEVNLSIDEKDIILQQTTSDMPLIDEWRDDAGELNLETIRTALKRVIDYNMYKLEEIKF